MIVALASRWASSYQRRPSRATARRASRATIRSRKALGSSPGGPGSAGELAEMLFSGAGGVSRAGTGCVATGWRFTDSNGCRTAVAPGPGLLPLYQPRIRTFAVAGAASEACPSRTVPIQSTRPTPSVGSQRAICVSSPPPPTLLIEMYLICAFVPGSARSRRRPLTFSRSRGRNRSRTSSTVVSMFFSSRARRAHPWRPDPPGHTVPRAGRFRPAGAGIPDLDCSDFGRLEAERTTPRIPAPAAPRVRRR